MTLPFLFGRLAFQLALINLLFAIITTLVTSMSRAPRVKFMISPKCSNQEIALISINY
jgi:hypothetical protein